MVFGQIMFELAKSQQPLASRVVTTAPDVATSTNLTGWANTRGQFALAAKEDEFAKNAVVGMAKWSAGPNGQHIELGIAENNLMLMLGAAGLSHRIHGHRLFPIGTLYAQPRLASPVLCAL